MTRQRALMGGVAAAILVLALGAGLSAASADSLPGSPLYGLKRGEESLMLALPQSENAHARTLSMIATRRLLEAQAEARAHNDAQAGILLKQYNDDMVQLIHLAASVNARNGDSASITSQISQVIQVQTSIQKTTASWNDSTFLTALNNSAATVQQTLQQQNVSLPGANGGASGKGHGNQPDGTPGATPSGTPAGTPSATPSGSPTVSPTPTPTPHGHGHGGHSVGAGQGG